MYRTAEQHWASRLSLCFQWLKWTLWTSVLLIASTAAALADGSPRDATVLIRNGSNQFSGTILAPTTDGRSFVATCAHGFVGRIGGPVPVFHNGVELAGVLRYFDKEHDVAIVEIPGGNYPHVELATDVPVGAAIETWGFPKGEGPLQLQSKVAANNYVHQCPAHRDRRAWVTMEGQVANGHSGGGLFYGGKLVAVASAVDGQRTLFCLPDALHRAYHAVASGVVNGARELFDCRGGRCTPRRPTPPRQPAPAPPAKPPQQGATGPQGPPGRDGKDGLTPQIDYDEIAKRIQVKVPPSNDAAIKDLAIAVQTLNGSISSMNRDMEILANQVKESSRQIKQSQLDVQDMRVHIQQLNNRISIVEKRPTTISIERVKE